jgi:hypothetical protein
MLLVKKVEDVEMPDPLIVPFSKSLTVDSSLEQISSFLDKEEKKLLAFAPWKAYAYRPDVRYTIAHGRDGLFLKYYVEEKFITAAHGRINDPVYEDSCVEFFISLDDKGYYNFEFNCIGTCLAAFGIGREQRIYLPAGYIEKIRTQSLITRDGTKGTMNWTLTLAIPFHTFKFHSLSSLSGMQCRVNFFKCGDSLPEPHFVTWTNIEAGEPDFHLPQFFGTVIFR